MGGVPPGCPTIDAFAPERAKHAHRRARRVSDRSARSTKSGRNAAMAWPQSQALFDRAKIETESLRARHEPGDGHGEVHESTIQI
jgi:hypothetical protein